MNYIEKKPIVAIDGPSGAGKSTVSRLVAQELGFIYIDTGAMYRCVALLALRAGLVCREGPLLDELLENLDINFKGTALAQLVFLGKEDVTKSIREHRVSADASRFSALPSVRKRLVALQRKMGQAGGVVMEGRDIGTNVFPEAQAKFFLEATAAERAGRRHLELKSKGQSISFDRILEDQRIRDENDKNRELNPLARAKDAIVVDTTGISIDMVVEKLCKMVKKKH